VFAKVRVAAVFPIPGLMYFEKYRDAGKKFFHIKKMRLHSAGTRLF
jgi:hypothetical protein